MATASENDGMFQEVFLLGITKKGGTEVQFAASCEDFTPGIADKDGESVVMGNGGRKWKRTPQGDSEVTIKLYPLSLSANSGNDVTQWFNGGTADSTPPFSSINTRNRDLFRVTFLLSDDPNASAASGVSSSGYAAYRYSYLDARLVSIGPSFGDKVFTHEAKFKIPAFDSSGSGLIKAESVGSADAQALPALSAYS